MSEGQVLDGSVLVLNRNYAAVNVCNVRRAFILLCKEAAEVIHVGEEDFGGYDLESWIQLSQIRDQFPDEDHEFVRTVSFHIRVPRVIRLLLYSRQPRNQVKLNRRNIYARDGNRCQYCGQGFPTSELTLDHILPRHRGGESSWTNMACCCVKCNVRKGGRLPEEAGLKLLREPVRPRVSPVIPLRLGSRKYQSWRNFLSEAYWSVSLE